MNTKIRKQLLLIITVFFLLISGSNSLNADQPAAESYKLQEVVVLSRHNIRAPLSTKGSALDTATPHTWYEWSSNTSELSLRGSILETAMGAYFRKWLESEGLFPENYRPEGDEVRFYANAKQRTIATAQYFSSGLLPVANIRIMTNQVYDQMDPVFTPQLTFVSDEYAEDAAVQMKGLMKDLSKEFELLSEVVDLKDSADYKEGKISDLDSSDVEFVLENNAEPGLKGSLKLATTLSDALVLQYYEQSDDKAAAFGHDLSDDDWMSIARILENYGEVLFTSPLISTNVANPLLKQISSELNSDERIFSFLCGHDSNIASVLAALEVEDYELPQAIETRTPIGSKLVFEKWEKDNEEYLKVQLIYNSVDQLRNISILDLKNPPVIYDLHFNGLQTNADGMYKYSDFANRLQQSIAEYDRLYSTYCPQEAGLPKTGID